MRDASRCYLFDRIGTWCGVLVAFSASATWAVQQVAVEELDPAQVVVKLSIGWATNDAANRNVRESIVSDGWTKFVTDEVQPLIGGGSRRFFLHNPFGAVANEVMQFDQAFDADDAQLNNLLDGFVEAWRPITQAPDSHRAEVIAYLGSIPKDNDFTRLQSDANAWYTRAWDSAKLPLRAGMSIAFDAWTGGSPDDLVYHFAQELQQAGVRIYIEPRPKADATHLHGMNTIAFDDVWLRMDPATNDRSDFAGDNLLTGEHIRIVARNNEYDSFDQWGTQAIAAILADGDTVSLPAHLMPRASAFVGASPASSSIVGPNVLIHDGQLNMTQSSLNLGDIDLKASALIDVVGEMRVRGSLSHAITDASRWRFADESTLHVGVAGENTTLEVAGKDVGDDHVGYEDNFSLSRLLIEGDAMVSLVDIVDNQADSTETEALYVDVLEFADASSLLFLNGVNVYYKMLIGDVSQLRGPGSLGYTTSMSASTFHTLSLVVPEPGGLSVLGTLLVGLVGAPRRRMPLSRAQHAS